MKTRNITLTIGLITGIIATGSYYKSPLDQLRESLTSAQITKDKVIVTDIHDVITKFSLTCALRAFWEMGFGNKLHFTKKTKDYFINNKSPKRSFESVALSERGDDEVYTQQAIALMNPHTPKAETVAILDELNNQGYAIYGCSNIGEKSYKFMKNKYPKAFKHLIACRTTNKNNDFRKKKDPASKAYLETLGLIKSQPKQIIVIDDKQENINQAKAQAQTPDRQIQGILFKKPKQLRQELEALGLLFSTVSNN